MRYRGWYTFNGNLENQKYSKPSRSRRRMSASCRRSGRCILATSRMAAAKYRSRTGPRRRFSSTTPSMLERLLPHLRDCAGYRQGQVDLSTPTRAQGRSTQPDLKTRGVAYWQAAIATAGEPVPEDRLSWHHGRASCYAVDADTGKPCASFANDGVLDVNQWNTINDKWPLSVLQPPTVYKDTLFIGWAGKDWADAEAPPGTVFARRRANRQARMDLRRTARTERKRPGPSNVWASMSIDPEHGILYLPVSARRARTSTAAIARRSCRSRPRSRRSTPKPARCSGAARSCITTSGTTTSTRRRCWSTCTRTARRFRR